MKRKGQSSEQVFLNAITVAGAFALLVSVTAHSQAIDFPEDEPTFTISFDDAALQEVAAVISAVTQRPIEIPDSRLGATTISYKPEAALTRPELWRAFVGLLAAEGLTLSASQDVWVIAERQEDTGEPASETAE